MIFRISVIFVLRFSVSTIGLSSDPAHAMEFEISRSITSGHVAKLSSSSEQFTNGETGAIELICLSRNSDGYASIFVHAKIEPHSTLAREEQRKIIELDKSASVEILVDGTFAISTSANIKPTTIYGIIYSVEIGGANIDRTRNVFGALRNNITFNLDFYNAGVIAAKHSYTFNFVPKTSREREIMNNHHRHFAKACYEE